MRRPAVLISVAVVAGGVALPAGRSADPVPYVAEFAPGRTDPTAQRFVLSPAFDPRGPSSFASSVAWVNEGEYLAVIAYGSGSCPNGPNSIAVVDTQELQVGLGPLFPDRNVCTADLGPHVTVVEVPTDISSAQPLVVRFEDREVTLPAVSSS